MVCMHDHSVNQLFIEEKKIIFNLKKFISYIYICIILMVYKKQYNVLHFRLVDIMCYWTVCKIQYNLNLEDGVERCRLQNCTLICNVDLYNLILNYCTFCV